MCSIWLLYWVNNIGLILEGILNLFFWGRLFSIVADTKNDQNGSSRDVGDAAFALTVKVIKSQCLLEGTHSLVLNALNRVYLKLYSNEFCHCFTLVMVNRFLVPHWFSYWFDRININSRVSFIIWGFFFLLFVLECIWWSFIQ